MEVQRDAVKYICETLEVPYPELSQGSFTLLTVFSDRREYVHSQVYMAN